MSELAPCPFCNCMHALSVHALDGGLFVWCDTNYWGCGARGAVASTSVAAAAAWNRRAPTANAPADPALLASVAEWRQLAETQDAIIQRGISPADPALLALARLGARLCRDQLSPTGGFCHVRFEHLDRIGIDVGVLMPGHLDSTGPVTKPGIADAIARLVAPDGAGEVAP